MADSTPVYAAGGDAPPAVYVKLQSRPAIPIGSAALGADQTLTSRPCILVGWSAREASGSASAAFRLSGGTAAGGQPIASISLATSGTDHEATGADGVFCASGLFFDWISGSVDIAVWVKV